MVVAEIHSVVAGLGEAVASALRSSRAADGFQTAGLPDAYNYAGALLTLHDRYGLNRGPLAQRIKG